MIYHKLPMPQHKPLPVLQKRFFLILFCLFFNTTGWSLTYYIDATKGTDQNSGLTPTTAWRTISKVNLSHFNPGDFILFKRGEIWREQLSVPSSGTSVQPILFGAYGTGENPIITGADLVNTWVAAGGNVYNATVTIQPYIVLFDNTVGALATSKATLHTNNEWFWAGNVLSIYSTIDPSIRVIEAGARTAAIFAASKNFITVENLTIRGTNGRSIRAGGDYWIITHNIIELTSAAISGDGSGSIAFGGTGHLITYNTIRNTLNDGIYGWKPVSATISNNTFVTNDGESSDNIQIFNGINCIISNNQCDQQFAFKSGKGNIIFDSGTGTIVEKNFCQYGHYGISGNDLGAIVRSNYSAHHTATDYAWGFAAAVGATGQRWYCNVSYDDRLGFYIPSAKDAQVYNNTLVGTVKTIVALDVENIENSEILNNIIWCPDGQAKVLSVSNAVTTRFDFNDLGPSRPGFMCYRGACFDTLSDFTRNIGQESHSLSVDPHFADIIGQNFRLASNSPCRNIGIQLGIPFDFDGLPMPAAGLVDLGAFASMPLLPPPKNVLLVVH